MILQENSQDGQEEPKLPLGYKQINKKQKQLSKYYLLKETKNSNNNKFYEITNNKYVYIAKKEKEVKVIIIKIIFNKI